MAKAFSNKEKEMISTLLKREAEDCMLKFGVRKTSIDELVQRVGISKGAFYAFFPSKEVLFFNVINDYHNTLQQKIIDRIKQLHKPVNSLDIAEILFDAYKMMDNPLMIHVISSGEVEYLMRKLPDDVVAEHQEQDDMAIKFLLEQISFDNEDIQIEFSAALRAIFLTMLHKREIGEGCFDRVLKTLLEGVCIKYIGK